MQPRIPAWCHALILAAWLAGPAPARADVPLAPAAPDSVLLPGAEVQVAIAVGTAEAPVQGLYGLGFVLVFDDAAFEVLSVEPGTFFTAGLGSSGRLLTFGYAEAGRYAFSVSRRSPQPALQGHGKAAVVTLRVRPGAEGDYELRLEEVDARTAQLDAIAIDAHTARLTVGKSGRQAQIPPGDPPDQPYPELQTRIDFADVAEPFVLTVRRDTTRLSGTPLPPAYHLALPAHWRIHKTGGGTFRAEVCFSLADLPPEVPPARLRVLKRSTTQEAWTPLLTVLRPDGDAPEEACGQGITSFSDFAVAAQAAEPAPTPLAPSDGASPAPGPVLLRWTAIDGASVYRVQLAADTTFTPSLYVATTAGTYMEALGLEDGTAYYWRVRAENAGGFGLWSAPRRFTTAPAAPTAPVPTTPLDGALHLPHTVSLAWGAADRADTYEVMLAADDAFEALAYHAEAVADTSAQVTGLAPGATYYWRVRARNAGGAGPWSPAHAFTTIPLAPSAPQALAPAPDARGVVQPVTLAWASLENAATYTAQVAASTDFAQPVFSAEALRDTTVLVDVLEAGTTYYWRVLAENAGGPGPWSSARTFTTQAEAPAPLAAPALATPTDGTLSVPIDAALTWNAVPGATGYDVQVATDAEFGRPVFEADAVTDLEVVPGGLSHGTAYYWRVRGRRAEERGPWSGTHTFTTIVAPPAAPLLLSPEAGAVLSVGDVILRWQPPLTAETYALEVATAVDFSDLVFARTGLREPEATVDGLTAGATYHWRVRAENAAGSGPWSPARDFTIASDVAREPLDLPTAYRLGPNYPNPFNPTTVLPFDLPRGGHVRLAVFNLLGEEVALLLDAPLAAGSHAVAWRAAGRPSGVYLARLQAGGTSLVHRLTLLK